MAKKKIKAKKRPEPKPLSFNVYRTHVETTPVQIVKRRSSPSSVRGIRAGTPYLRQVEGGVIKSPAATDGLLVTSPTGDVFVSLDAAMRAIESLLETDIRSINPRT